MDTFSQKKRSEIMSKIRSKNTIPEKRIRSSLHKLGYRFRLNDSTLPGKPDIVLKQFKVIIFINGCFWHQHPGCRLARIPKTNTHFWKEKLKSNILKLEENRQELKNLGYRVLKAWECEIYRNPGKVALMLAKKINRCADIPKKFERYNEIRRLQKRYFLSK